MSHDDLDHIPSIIPTRDNAPQRSPGAGKSERRSGSRGGRRQSSSTTSSGILARLVTAVALVVAAAACVWAWQLQVQLQQAGDQMEGYAVRIGDLEARLSDTDEGMSQSAAVQAVKIAELETEVRKLWDNVWKESSARLSKLEADSTSSGKSIKGLQSSFASAQSTLNEISGDISKLKSVGGDLARLMSSAKANQAEVERVADTLNRINLNLAKLEKRVADNEEWVASVDAFRRQVNASLTELQAAVRATQVSP